MIRQTNLGTLEQQVMEFLWKHGSALGEAVRQGVSKERMFTDSTIRTVLRRLEAKGFVEHRVEGRQFVYSSVREPRKLAVDHVRQVVRKFCSGSLEELLMGLVDQQVIDSGELRRLAAKIEARSNGKKP